MKILLNGATAGTNYGDFLFAKMFQDRVAEPVGIENTYWYDSRFAYSDFYKKHLANYKKYKLSEIDALVYISGGYFCGDDKMWKHYVIRFLSYFVIGLRCMSRKIPYGIFGVEVGRSKSRIIHAIASKILRKAQIVIVRNRASYDYATSFGVKNVICTADSVFAMKESLFADACENEQLKACSKKCLLLHINPQKERNHVIKEKVVPIMNAFLCNHPEYAVVISADQFYAEQDEALEDMAQQLQCDVIIKNRYDDPLALCKVIQSVDTVVTTKLHVGIVGAKLGKSVISFSGHTEKISRLYDELGEKERTCSLAQLDNETGLAMLEAYHDKPIVVPQEIVDKAEKNFEYLVEFLQYVSRRIKP